MTAPTRAGVAGGGTMGVGIVHRLLANDVEVVLVERDDTEAAAARERVAGSLTRAAQRGYLDADVDGLLARLAVAGTPDALADVEVVVEAVPEVPGLKAELLARIEGAVADDTVIGSNTSSLSIDGLAGGLRRPERFCGMHFFNPVPASDLLELIRGADTGADAMRTAAELGERLGLTTIEVGDAPGFATSRLGVALGLEAIRMVEDGVASAEDIDTALRLGYKHPVGPLRLTDLVGLDVRLGIAEYLAAELGPRFEPPALLRQMVADGRLGKKSGQGFFPWE
ncbi:3-hydroxyacyl-CoA dehydrogenase family protein [Egicoccus halophilus]|uniref:3-hydroxyacyl-CoA dehydrogenase n=1 Tax=Egicoccus halophilus TaxID=1670830 RepID=A0A8J3AHH2_9ACTN|nr:3-hydroxyacyl-CoA dehydrogenase family protein [Egicoccus halophilus]GGI09477.1 3-hydroxyacyl-CoA dehydrogenase [Egicoccus halophilus]